MISFNNVSFTYRQSGYKVENLNLHISKGELVVLVGHSGSGKTTITRILNGLNPTFYHGDLTGEIFIDGIDTNNLSMWKRGEMVGSIFQDPRSQFFSHQVEGEIAFGCENYGYKTERIRRCVHNSIDALGIERLKGKELLKLSNGERQLTAIASIYALGPKIYVFDEPSSNLDINATKRLSKIMKYLKSQNCTIVVAEHRLWYLLDIADRLIYLENGRIVDSLSPDEFKNRYENTKDKLCLRRPNKPKLFRQSNPGNNSKPIFKVKNLSFSYNNQPVFNDVNFMAEKGDIIALTGKNGVGKTTLAKVLSGLYKNKKGLISLDGKLLLNRQRRKSIRFIPHDTDTQLFSESVLEELLLMTKKTPKDVSKALKLLEDFDLLDFKDMHPAILSGGQKQRLVLATAMMENYRVLILDEPTSELDNKNMMLVAKSLKRISKNGTIIIIITHDIELINACCNNIYKLHGD